LVAGDPHRTIETPGVYVQAHVACDEWEVAGLAFPGVPGFPHFGHTERVAWCVTNANADYQDLYVERFRNGGAEVHDGRRWVGVEGRTELVTIRDEVDPVPVDVAWTRHGPVLFGDPASGYALAMRATALDEPAPTLGVLEPMLRARSVLELEQSLAGWVDPVNNLVAADRDGALLYRTVGRIPIRSAACAWGPVPGWTDDHEWRGMVPYDELPRELDPAEGVLVTANQRIVARDFPHYLGLDYTRPDRALRVWARLRELDRPARVADMAAIHRDRRALGADAWVERLTRVVPRDDVAAEARDLLVAWDRTMDAGSGAAAVYMAARGALTRLLAGNSVFDGARKPVRGEPPSTFLSVEQRLWPLVPPLFLRDDALLLERGATWDRLFDVALHDGVDALRTRFGDDVTGWRWGALHHVAPHNPLGDERLDPAPFEAGGEWDTVFATSHAAGSGFDVTSGSVARYVFDIGDWDASGWIVPHGASGDPASPHFADQHASWAAGELVPMRWGWAAILEHATADDELGPG
jgi:penicillin amidase